MLICSKCGSPALEMTDFEELEGDRWRETYKCKSCGAKGIKKVDGTKGLRKPKIVLRGSIEWEEEI